MILSVKNDRCAGPLQRPLGIERRLSRCNLTRPLFKLAVRSMQRGAAVDAHGLCSFLKLLVAGFVVLFVIVVFWLSVTAPGGPLLLLILAATARLAITLLAGPLSTVCPGGPLLLLILAATARLAVTLLAGPLSTIWALILVPPFIFSFSAFLQAAQPIDSSGGHGPWCGGSCSTACRSLLASRQPPRLGKQRTRQFPCRGRLPWPFW